MLPNPKLRVCSWLYLTLNPPDFEALCVGALDALAMNGLKQILRGHLWCRKARSGGGNSALGPLPFTEGVRALGTGLVPSPIKGQDGPRSFKAEEAVPVFFQIPLMMGSVSLKTSVIQRWEAFPKLREDGTSSQSPGGNGRENSQGARKRQLFGNPEPHGSCLAGRVTPQASVSSSRKQSPAFAHPVFRALFTACSVAAEEPLEGERALGRGGKWERECGQPSKRQFRIVILINKTNFLLREEHGSPGGKEDAISCVRNLWLKDFCVNVSPKPGASLRRGIIRSCLRDRSTEMKEINSESQNPDKRSPRNEFLKGRFLF